MKKQPKAQLEYKGFEQGPIRPPSEAHSLLIRVTRNCPWNRCTFCPVYKDTRFSIRPVDHVKRDIDSVYNGVNMIRQKEDGTGKILRAQIRRDAEKFDPPDPMAFNAAMNWYADGMQSIFIQDANSLIIRPDDLINILKHIKSRFPHVKRITSYARSHTIARITDQKLKEIKSAGLNRIHIGMESGSDVVLKMVKKGSLKKTHIKAGLKVKNAGMELSEYIMPGLGGREYSTIHALETADALNKINPDFIRLRTLAIPGGVPLFHEYSTGRFKKCKDVEMVEEIHRLIENLDGITGVVQSDHILNLFENVKGKLPEDKDKMLAILKGFLEMEPEKQAIYQVGRRLGLFSGTDDMKSSARMVRAQKACAQFGITPENVDDVIDELMRRFI